MRVSDAQHGTAWARVFASAVSWAVIAASRAAWSVPERLLIAKALASAEACAAIAASRATWSVPSPTTMPAGRSSSGGSTIREGDHQLARLSMPRPVTGLPTLPDGFLSGCYAVCGEPQAVYTVGQQHPRRATIPQGVGVGHAPRPASGMVE